MFLKLCLSFTDNLRSRYYYSCLSRREQAGRGSVYAADEWYSWGSNSDLTQACVLSITPHSPRIGGAEESGRG